VANHKRLRDPNQLAKFIVAVATQEAAIVAKVRGPYKM
jgi:hypothetical protein